MIHFIYEWLKTHGFGEQLADVLSVAAAAVFVISLSLVARLITRRFFVKWVAAYIERSKNKWDDILVKRRVLERAANLVPAIIIHIFAPVFSVYQDWIQRLAFAYMVLLIFLFADPLLDVVDDIYRNFEVSKTRPIKGYLQVVKIVLYVAGTIIIIGILINRSPWLLLSGLGALTAVLMLMFQNSILGFVAGIQLTSNDMVRLGDWIEMPKYNADGDVIDITLHTVKVRNWDKTITTIPTHALISDSFKNWRGMTEAGGRRIKRSVYIDMNSIKFCTEEMLQRFEKIHYLAEYIKLKRIEIEEYNRRNNIDPSQLVNGRRMTNIGTFRAYVLSYLKNHPKIHHGMTLLVRQLAPAEHGLPIEIYCFTNDTAWANYEGIQADIFDHILAVIPQFELQVYQNPTGHDINRAVLSLSTPAEEADLS